jgi:hypothetical protein
MKITRGQLRALVDRTEGFVDELECELDIYKSSGNVVLKFHHIVIEVTPQGRYIATSNGEPLAEGAIEPQTNEGWGIRQWRFRRT